ncbi:MAG: YrhK family protein, partial [Candidatus Parvarchaeota archaeon]
KIKEKYAKIGMINDLMIGLEFLLGSIQFLPGMDYSIGVYFFIVGSFQILLIPTIRIIRDAKLKGKRR